MLVPWMLYAFALSAIIAGSALALDKVAELWGAARRPVWLAAIIVTLVLPMVAALAPTASGIPTATATSSPSAEERQSFRVATRAPARWRAQRLRAQLLATMSSAPINRRVANAWACLSLAFCAAFLFGAVRLQHRRSRWTRAAVDGHDVMISGDVGPAVIGTLRPRVVLPAWALALSEVERDLMLRHEAEHVRGRDPLVLAFAALAVTVSPWNPVVWFLVRRLRLALEIDCDARVLERVARPRDYGLLLLTVGARSQATLHFSASLAEPHSFLERRIVAMTMSRAPRPFTASLPFIAIAAFAAAAAAQAPRPTRAQSAAPSALPSTVPTVAPTMAPAAAPDAGTGVSATIPTTAPVASTAPSAGVAKAPIAITAPATAPSSSHAPSASTIPLDTLRAWTQRYHPNVAAGDLAVNEVVFVVDANEQYLRSYARFDSVADGARGDAPRGRGSFVGDTVRIKPLVTTSPSDRPVYIVDGVVVSDIDSIERDRIRSVEVLKGAAAIAKYGPDAQRGVIVIDTKSENMLASMGIEADHIQQVDVVKLRAGTIGPNPLRVLVVQLK